MAGVQNQTEEHLTCEINTATEETIKFMKIIQNIQWSQTRQQLAAVIYKTIILVFLLPASNDDKSYLGKSGWLTMSTNMVGVPYTKVHLGEENGHMNRINVH